ncbi:MAG: hypothetical protein WCY06_05850 [Flavobacteriaceae bacterium]
MRVFIIMFISSLFFFSCNSYKRERFTYYEQEKKIWINSYKYQVFYGCIERGIGNDSLRIILKNKDLFSKNSNVNFFIIDQAREYGKRIIEEMPDANIKIDKGEEYLRNKNFISYNCLVYYASRELDSIANNAYKQYIENKQSK